MAQETILLTGATGNVGAVTLEHLLGLNHIVHLILRRPSSINHFKSKFPAAFNAGNILFTVVPDMAVPGVFDKAAATATAIFHIATPLASDNFVKNMVEPTWTIDLNVLEAAKKSSTVKRVVICGTILQAASYMQFFDPNFTVSEETYNEIQLEEGVDDWATAYQYAKTSAEHKTWAWLKSNPKSAFDIVMLLPPSITGRSPQEGFKPSADNAGGIGGIYKALLNGGGEKEVDGGFPIWLDTDDVARTHVLSLDRTKVPGNERYVLASSEPLDLRAIVSKLRKEKPEWASRLPEVEVLPTSRLQGKFATINTAKADKVFGTDWKSAYDSIKETVTDAIKLEKKNAL